MLKSSWPESGGHVREWLTQTLSCGFCGTGCSSSWSSTHSNPGWFQVALWFLHPPNFLIFLSFSHIRCLIAQFWWMLTARLCPLVCLIGMRHRKIECLCLWSLNCGALRLHYLKQKTHCVTISQVQVHLLKWKSRSWLSSLTTHPHSFLWLWLLCFFLPWTSSTLEYFIC